MYAVIRTGGKQYRVAPGDVVDVDRLPGDTGASISFSEVLATEGKIGAPLIDGASVVAEIVETASGRQSRRLQEEAPQEHTSQARAPATTDAHQDQQHFGGLRNYGSQKSRRLIAQRTRLQ